MLHVTIDDLYRHMPWESVDAVVFDVGDVLIRMDPDEVLEVLYPGNAELHEKVKDRTIRTPYWNLLDGGTLTLQESIKLMIGREQALADAISAFMLHWPEFNHPVWEGVETARCCKDHQKQIYILSNYPSEHFQWNEEHFSFLEEFDGKIISAREHLIKPKPEIYRLLTDRFELAPARTLFIDDMTMNVASAMNEGWLGLCYHHPGKLTSFFNT